MKQLYESYHSNRKLQKWVISEDNFTYKNIIQILKRYIRAPKRILDIGCGVGTVDFYLVSKGCVVVGIDISRNAVQTAQKNANLLKLGNKVNFEQMAFPAKIPNGQFDIIVCSEILEHIKQDKEAVGKFRNILNKNGLVIASSPTENAPLYKLGLLKEFDKKVGHLRRYTESEFKKLFINSGFRILEIKNTEGVLRNFLFTNRFTGPLLRIVNKWPFSKIVSFIDDITISIFGSSQIYIVAKKQ